MPVPPSLPDSKALMLPLPSDVPNAYLLFCRLDTRDTPTADSLRPLIRNWVAQNVNAPLRDLVLPFLELPLVTIQISESRALRPDIMQNLEKWVGENALAQIQQATHCIVVRSPDVLRFPRVGLWTCLAGGLACAQRFGGVLVDADTSRAFSTRTLFSSLHNQGLFHIRHFILVPISQDERGLSWMTTRGMARFGLPEVQVRDIPLIDLEQLVFVVCGVCQALAGQVMRVTQEAGKTPETLTLPPEMRLTWADLQVARGLPPEQPIPMGCAGEGRLWLTSEENPPTSGRTFLTLRPPGAETADYGAWLHNPVHAFFPAEDTRNRAPVDAEAMAQAHQQALATLPEAKRRFVSGALGQSRLGLKHGFPTEDGGHEYLWVFVTSWQGNQIIGQITNTPQKRLDLRSGQSVALTESDIYDWTIVHPDAPSEGGFTDALLTRPTETAPDKHADEAEIKRRYQSYVSTLTQPRGTSSGGWTPWPIALARSLFGAKPAPQRNQVQEDLAVQGRLVIAFIVMANSALMAPGRGDAPCLALFVFDEQERDTEFLIGVVERLSDLKGTSPQEPEMREAAVLVNEEAYVPYRRRRVPPALTGGRTVYAVDLMIRRAHLPEGYLQAPLLPCLAWPGEEGPIEMLPWRLLEDL